MLPTLFVILTFSMLYWFPIRRWMSHWGATPSDLTRFMAGDALLANPTYSGTLAVTVNAAPEHPDAEVRKMGRTVISTKPNGCMYQPY